MRVRVVGRARRRCPLPSTYGTVAPICPDPVPGAACALTIRLRSAAGEHGRPRAALLLLLPNQPIADARPRHMRRRTQLRKGRDRALARLPQHEPNHRGSPCQHHPHAQPRAPQLDRRTSNTCRVTLSPSTSSRSPPVAPRQFIAALSEGTPGRLRCCACVTGARARLRRRNW